MCIGDTYKTQTEDFVTRLVRVPSTCGVANGGQAEGRRSECRGTAVLRAAALLSGTQ